MELREAPILLTRQGVSYFCSSEENRGVGIQAHAFVYTAHQVLQLCVAFEIRLLLVAHNLVNLFMDLSAVKALLQPSLLKKAMASTSLMKSLFWH